MTDLALLHGVSDLLYREAACLDEQRWDDWLALFTEDCEYWVAAWKGDHETTCDPATEISLIYCNSRSGLEDRIARIRSGLSAASTPLPRTWHLVGNVRLGGGDRDGLSVFAQWESRAYRFEETQAFYGSCQYRLVERGGGWRIRRKRTVVVNDLINTVLDVYNL